MTLEELKRQNAKYANKINLLKLEQDSFQQEHYKEFCKLFEDKQEIDKKWFIENFDFIWKHKERFKYNEPFKDIVIDFLPIYKTGGIVGGCGFNGVKSMIYLDSLITMWDEGFTYNSYPIISLKVYYHNGKQVSISYIKDNQEIEEVFGSNYENTFTDLQLEHFTDMIKCFTSTEDKISRWDRYKTIDILKKRED